MGNKQRENTNESKSTRNSLRGARIRSRSKFFIESERELLPSRKVILPPFLAFPGAAQRVHGSPPERIFPGNFIVYPHQLQYL